MRLFPDALALIAITVVVLVEAILIASPGPAAILVLISLWFAASGIILVWCALADRPGARSMALFVGPILGFGFGVAAMLVFWAVGVQNGAALVLGPLVVCATARFVRRGHGLNLELPVLTRRDVVGAAVALLIVPLVTFAPYAKVRSHVAEGDAYRAYFTADFVWAMAATAEIAKGDVPPVNPFHHVEPMRYYWLSHMLSGATYRSLRPLHVEVEPIILINGLAFGLAFTGFFYWLVRAVGASPSWAALFVVVGFAANSYEGADMIRAVVTHGDPWDTLLNTNIDSVTRWFYKGMAVDGLHRLLLYQPHHLAGYALGLTALWLVALAVDVGSIAIPLAAGILLALALLFSTFGALILTLATALTFLFRLIQQRAFRTAGRCALLAGAPLLVGLLLTRRFGYTHPADGLLMTFGLNPVAVHFGGWVLFLGFGPLLLFGMPGLLRPRWSRAAGMAPLALAVAAFLFYFFVDVPDMGGVWVGWRSGHMLLIAFAAAAAAGLTGLWRVAESKAAVISVVAAAIVLAVPTVAIDVYNAQDTANRGEGAGFPWTLVITPSEREAFDWIRSNLPADAVVQPEPFVRDPATWAYVPAFAERRMAAGLPISMTPRHRYANASEEVQLGIFKAVSADVAHDWANTLDIDYVLIGDRERWAYGPVVNAMLSRPDLFQQAFRNDAMLLLKVVNHPGADARHR